MLKSGYWAIIQKLAENAANDITEPVSISLVGSYNPVDIMRIIVRPLRLLGWRVKVYEGHVGAKCQIESYRIVVEV